MELTEYDKAILWNLFNADSLRQAPWSQKRYVIYSDSNYRGEIKESTALSLVAKGVIQPSGLSIKEWKVQIALGTVENVELILTELGALAATAHTEWSDEFRKEQIADRLRIDSIEKG
ncbi:hypothetical protein LCGC14_1513780 [marine sediment metagenome]|uniref:Uncharacterized protein n=1 Tax=marine sediment metagenome TaxID=412755 RepID=A0A0F9LG82_9ZZZZ